MEYSKLKHCIRVMFWSGVDFDEPDLEQGTGKLKDASIHYTDAAEVNEQDLTPWLAKGRKIQWGYKNIHKRKGHLERLV